jgi:predicted nucleic acid-binding protein
LHDAPAVYDQWRTIVAKHEVAGIQVHDARLAAAMQVHNIARILTYDPRDFSRYDGITAIPPGEVT